jgi:hypothetical protein
VLNRSLNFRSHGAVAPQLGIFTVVAAVNYFALILGIGAGLTTVGVDYRLSRLIAGACESVYMYAAMRWLVFRDAAAVLAVAEVPERTQAATVAQESSMES